MHTASALLRSDMAQGAEGAQKRLRGAMGQPPLCVCCWGSLGVSEPLCRGVSVAGVLPLCRVWVLPARAAAPRLRPARVQLRTRRRWLRVLAPGPFPPAASPPSGSGAAPGCPSAALAGLPFRKALGTYLHLLELPQSQSTTRNCFF